MIVAPLLVLLLPLPQDPATSPLTTGARVRVTVRDGAGPERSLVGPLRTFDAQELTMVPEGAPSHVSLSRSTITRIEVSRGRRSRAGRGLLLGAVLGLAAVAVKEAACGEDCEPDWGLMAAGVGGGALAGAGVGAMMRSERWEPQGWAVGAGRRSGPPAAVNLTLRF